jgi:hypothetical protein
MGFFNKIKDSLTASEFDVKGQTKVKTLRKHFAEEFGCTLRVYYGKRFADGDYTLAKIRSDANPGSGEEFKVRASWTVSEVEQKFMDSFGVTVQVANAEDTELADNSSTLGEVSRN